MNTKVLIITYYWPPSGGSGVQRWVKLTKYLQQYNVLPYILTVDENFASYMQWDSSLTNDVSPDINVYKTKSFEPINFYSKVVGKENVPTAGFSNVDNNKWTQKLVNSIRSNLFIPDPRRGWNQYAYKKAVELIQKENISIVLVSSPPHSSQLIGLKLKRKLDVKWIADLRDPWTDIYYYKLLGHSFISRSIDQSLEKNVLVKADRIITVSDQLKKLFCSKDPRIDPSKLVVIPNGFDVADFNTLKKEDNQVFTICYTGTMADIYEPLAFFKCLEQLKNNNPDLEIKLQIVGKVSEFIERQTKSFGFRKEFIGTVPHNRVVEYQKNANLLLLIIPNVSNAEGILTGKLFEYLASGNNIICIGPERGDAAKIIDTCNLGKTFNRSRGLDIVDFLQRKLDDFYNNRPNKPDWKKIRKYSRERQAGEVGNLVNQLLIKHQ